MSRARIAVVGGGISGVATAYYLKKAGLEPEIIEQSSALGGRAGSATLGDRVIDIGGKNIGRRYALFREFIADHGSPPLEFFGINSSTVRSGKLHTIDSQKRFSSLLALLRLVGVRDFLQLVRLARLVHKHPEEALLGGPYFSAMSEKRDHATLPTYFNPRTVESFLRPITLRMNGAEPDEYYYGCLGSNIKMLIDKYDQLTFGMSDLLARFQKAVVARLGTTVRQLQSNGSRTHRLLLEDRDGTSQWHDYDHVVLALPAPCSARLLNDQVLTPALDGVAYYPVTLIVARYARPIFDAQVRAIVFDQETALSNAGSYGRESRDIVRYTLSGRKARELDANLSSEEVLALAERSLRRYVDVSEKDRLDFICRRFDHGLCAYSPYHHRLLETIRSWEQDHPGLVLTGDYIAGASIESCFEAGRDAAQRTVQALETSAEVGAPSPEPLFSHDGQPHESHNERPSEPSKLISAP